jgi:hypothetical protein
MSCKWSLLCLVILDLDFCYRFLPNNMAAVINQLLVRSRRQVLTCGVLRFSDYSSTIREYSYDPFSYSSQLLLSVSIYIFMHCAQLSWWLLRIVVVWRTCIQTRIRIPRLIFLRSAKMSSGKYLCRTKQQLSQKIVWHFSHNKCTEYPVGWPDIRRDNPAGYLCLIYHTENRKRA